MSKVNDRYWKLIGYMGNMGIDEYKEVEFEFDARDLRVLKEVLKKINERTASEYAQDKVLAMMGVNNNMRNYERDNDFEFQLLDALNEKPTILGSDIFQYLCDNLYGDEIVSLIESAPGLLSCLGDAAKIYFGVDELTIKDLDTWLKKQEKKDEEALKERMRRSML